MIGKMSTWQQDLDERWNSTRCLQLLILNNLRLFLSTTKQWRCFRFRFLEAYSFLCLFCRIYCDTIWSFVLAITSTLDFGGRQTKLQMSALVVHPAPKNTSAFHPCRTAVKADWKRLRNRRTAVSWQSSDCCLGWRTGVRHVLQETLSVDLNHA
ncbi:hypothetical protein RvY_02735 [Ramazzottius varieornatus]|uniref:Uncharacterized protein n=1 Tax=Ramazzottius varieornatus TaxID=947166 RepID=A0A1D1UKR7_RAMVA|nr:hypothetical protein RvY_02735 [Ramazzottius varieornatus]